MLNIITKILEVHSNVLTCESSLKQKPQCHLAGGEGVGGDVEGGHLHVGEETVEILGVEDDLGERLVADALPQHDPTVQCYLGCIVPLSRQRVLTLWEASR